MAADGVKSAIRDGLEKDRELTKALSGGEMRVTRFARKNDFVYKVRQERVSLFKCLGCCGLFFIISRSVAGKLFIFRCSCFG